MVYKLALPGTTTITTMFIRTILHTPDLNTDATARETNIGVINFTAPTQTNNTRIQTNIECNTRPAGASRANSFIEVANQ